MKNINIAFILLLFGVAILGSIFVLNAITITNDVPIQASDNLVYRVEQLEGRVQLLEERVEQLENPTPAISGFTFIERLEDKDALQGVASDGTYLYVTSSPLSSTRKGLCALYKYTKDGALVDKHMYPQDEGTPTCQVNGIFVRGDKLYLGSFVEAATSEERQSYIKIFNSHDLNFVKEYPVGNHGCEGCFYKYGYWWVIYTGQSYISQYSYNWDFIDQYFLPYSLEGGRTTPNGMMWVGDYLYINHHEATGGAYNATTLDCYKWNGIGFDPIARLERPTEYCSQGLYKEPDEDIVWWAERHGGGQGIHNIVKTSIIYKED